MKNLENFEEYKQALLKKKELETDIKNLNNVIIKYKNEKLIKDLKSLDELKNWIFEAQEGEMVIFDGIKYILQDLGELIDEYGNEEINGSIYGAKLQDLISGGRIGILKIVK
jgi:hypothetical protein